jgi:hypothetical protein
VHGNAPCHHQHLNAASIMQKVYWENEELEVLTPPLQYKIYLHNDDKRVHACHFLHQIG